MTQCDRVLTPHEPPGLWWFLPVPRADSRALIRSNNSCSNWAMVSSSLILPISRSKACFCQRGAFSKLPPIPTPTTMGGQGLGPAAQRSLPRNPRRLCVRRRSEHLHCAHILTAAAFGRQGQFDLIPRTETNMKNGRGVISIIFCG